MILLLLSTFAYHAILVSDLRFQRDGSEARVQLLPYHRGGMAEVQNTAQEGLSQFILNRCGAGALTALLPLRPVDSDEIVVERLLGSGSFGLVVQVRLERRDGQMLPRHEQEVFALKLQTIQPHGGSGPSNVLTNQQAAMREREVYQRIWQTRDEETGRTGHPFIVRLVCASNWPEGRELFYEGTEDPVVLNGIKSFHYALMMEYVPLGSLAKFIPRRMRCGVDNTPPYHRAWRLLIRRFAAEIVLALDFLHNTKGVVYRDLKADNVLVVKQGQESSNDFHVKLSDFGLSRPMHVSALHGLSSVPSDFSGVSASLSSYAGTPYYAAPEMVQMTHGVPCTVALSLDIFSFGMLLFVLTYGSEPYMRLGARALPRKISFGSHNDDENSDSGQQLEEPELAQWRKVAFETLPSNFPKDQIQWWASDRMGQPHPLMAPSSWEADLQQLITQSQCPRHAVQVIRDCCGANPRQRPNIAEVRTSDLFGRIGSTPPIDWISLEGLDI